jgi:hypothetical protein
MTLNALEIDTRQVYTDVSVKQQDTLCFLQAGLE